MSAPEALAPPPSPYEVEATEEIYPKPRGFRTAQGSAYTYDSDGKTTRFKTATGEQHDRQDITVFSPLSLEDEQDYLLAYRSENPDRQEKVYVVERQSDGTPKIIRDVREVTLPSNLYLTITRGNQIIKFNGASLEPTVGANVFDTRHYEENGRTMTERHLGNKVTEIIY
jgi:hypothetical protein